MSIKLLSLVALTGAIVFGQNQPVLGEDTVKVSEHVWAIMGWPNIGIVIGNNAALVVDTGLGPRNGATISRVVAKLAPNKKLYLTTTHFHPEHAGGEAGFPQGTILVRSSVQQKEVETSGKEVVDQFASRSEQQKELLANATFRKPDILFDKETKVDLGGGVTVRVFWFGGAHTKGDQLIFIDPDRTLISGDVVQNKMVPNIFRDGGTPASWLAVLDKIAALKPLHVLPTHSAPGDGSLVALEKSFISDLRTAGLEMKKKGVSVEDAAKELTEVFKKKYSDWPSMNITGFLRSVYAE